jgi:hypothetical protein
MNFEYGRRCRQTQWQFQPFPAAAIGGRLTRKITSKIKLASLSTLV